MYEVDEHTVALLHFEDGIKDESSKIWVTMGNAVTTTSESKIGNSSLYLSGNGQYLTIAANTDFNVGAGNFTVDCWIKRKTMLNRGYGLNVILMGVMLALACRL